MPWGPIGLGIGSGMMVALICFRSVKATPFKKVHFEAPFHGDVYWLIQSEVSA
jgi:hypothetical protein